METNLRTFEKNTPQYQLYKELHERQTLGFVLSKINQYKKLNNCIMKIQDVLKIMDEFIDPSDPDVDLPNSFHAYQTAEFIKKKY